MSERLSQREFASKVATAFDCHDYVKRKKVGSITKQISLITKLNNCVLF